MSAIISNCNGNDRMIGSMKYEPDILTGGLDVVFCGINPAWSAAVAGHNFSHRSNRFWSALHLAGFTDECLEPEGEQRLLQYGCGITVAVRRPTCRAEDVATEEFVQARAGFEAKMRSLAPRSIAFLGKRPLSAMTGQANTPWGRQPIPFAGTLAWVLPNPSGLNRSVSLKALVAAYSELRMVLRQQSLA